MSAPSLTVLPSGSLTSVNGGPLHVEGAALVNRGSVSEGGAVVSLEGGSTATNAGTWTLTNWWVGGGTAPFANYGTLATAPGNGDSSVRLGVVNSGPSGQISLQYGGLSLGAVGQASSTDTSPVQAANTTLNFRLSRRICGSRISL